MFYAVKPFRQFLRSIYKQQMLRQKLQKLGKEYNCEKCDYICSNLTNFNKHLSTAKHIARQCSDNAPQCCITYTCACGNMYKHRQSYNRHNKVCNYINDPSSSTSDNIPPPPTIDAALVLELLKQNQEFKTLIIEQNKQMMELANKAGNTNCNNNNNNTTNNNKFNLNVFLNETCKDAISMDDFINSIEVTRDEFIHTGQVGFIEGISTVMAHRFRNMDMHTRPLHCTDLKRETIYIKNADKWEKDDADKTKMRKAVRGVAKKNMKELWRWYNDNKPAVEQIGTDVCEDYFKFHKAALGGYGKEEDLKFEDKIMHNVLKEVQVDKSSSLTV
jgi:hypothetical protein